MVSIQTTETMGRGFFVTKNIEIGEEIFSDPTSEMRITIDQCDDVTPFCIDQANTEQHSHQVFL